MGRSNDQGAAEAPEGPRRSGGMNVAVAVAAAALIAALLLDWRQAQTAPAVPKTGTDVSLFQAGKPIDGIPCSDEILDYHVHAHLEILSANKQVTVPAYVGITDRCLYWLHTHDDSGIIHVEGPHRINLTLGQFFDIWGQALSRSEVAGVKAASGRQIRVYVNLKPYGGDPRRIVLHAHTLVTIEVGPPFSDPLPYDFQGL